MKRLLLLIACIISVHAMCASSVNDEQKEAVSDWFLYRMALEVLESEYDVIYGDVSQKEVLVSRGGDYFIINLETWEEKKIFSEFSYPKQEVPAVIKKLVPYYKDY